MLVKYQEPRRFPPAVFLLFLIFTSVPPGMIEGGRDEEETHTIGETIGAATKAPKANDNFRETSTPGLMLFMYVVYVKPRVSC